MVMASKSEKDWEIESAADSLIKAVEIRRKPELYKKALGILKERQAAMNVVEEDGAAVRAKRRGK